MNGEHTEIPEFVVAIELPKRATASNYPAEVQRLLSSRLTGREKRALGEFLV